MDDVDDNCLGKFSYCSGFILWTRGTNSWCWCNNDGFGRIDIWCCWSDVVDKDVEVVVAGKILCVVDGIDSFIFGFRRELTDVVVVVVVVPVVDWDK